MSAVVISVVIILARKMIAQQLEASLKILDCTLALAERLWKGHFDA